jgi:hypothetical protein
MTDPRAREREEEARIALDRVRRETEGVGGSAAARAAGRLRGHFSGADARGAEPDGGTDPIEVWGRRIGRALSVVLAVALVWWLAVQLGAR